MFMCLDLHVGCYAIVDAQSQFMGGRKKTVATVGLRSTIRRGDISHMGLVGDPSRCECV